MLDEVTLGAYLTARARVNPGEVTAGSILSGATSVKEIMSYDSDGKAHIAIDGVLSQNGPDIIDMIIGQDGTGYRQIVSSLLKAHGDYLDANDTDSPIFLHVNSPGGLVSGAEVTAAAVRRVADKRPVYAINEGTMASAALWVSSGATDILSNGRSTQTGSVGAIASVLEHDNDKLKLWTFVNPESPDKIPDPSTEDGAQVFIDRASSIYSIFRDDLIAGRRGRTTVKSIESLRGAVVTADRAKEAGLIDGIIKAGESFITPAEAGKVGIAASAAEDREENMNLSELLQEHPEVKAELDTLISQARAEGDKAAVDRQSAIVAQLKPIMDAGYPERVKTACADAIVGTRSIDSVLDLVSLFDEIRAVEDGRRSDEEQEDMPDTPSSGPEIKAKADDSLRRDAEWNEAIKGLLG